MNILILGCGAIGGFYASRLQKSCNSITVTARGQHLRAIQQNGLKVTHDGEESVNYVDAINHQELTNNFQSNQFDLVIISLKANQLLNVITELGSWLKLSQCPILSLQNGVDSEAVLADTFGENRVWGGMAIKIGGEVVEPGEIISTGIAKITFGPWPVVKSGQQMPSQLTNFAKCLALANIPFELTSDIRLELWKKLVINNGVNPLSAITGLNTFELTHDPSYVVMIQNAMQETVEAARYDGVELTQQDVDNLFDLIKNFSAIKTSMLIDKEKGREIELDAIVGAVIKRCQKQGIPAPQNQEFSRNLTESVR
ncbi:MAG: 2-dehydropantoate 2-reductase [Glaciecola sp.]|jgi:2-dehydropantoate 2-reductase